MKSAQKNKNIFQIVRFVTLSILTITIARIVFTAWMAEDAFITMRVIDNFVNGYGLRWNIDERVQVYTHPLWLFWLTPWYAITKEPFLTTMVASIITSILALFVAVHLLRRKYKGGTEAYARILFFLAPLMMMRGFVEFSTSGLENPLSHLLIAIFFFVLIFGKKYKYLWLVFIASLAALNRLDHCLLFIPVLAYLYISHVPIKHWWKGLLAAFPIIGWLVFSFIYYGFPLPNTYYAKLNILTEQSVLWKDGLYYLEDLVVRNFSGAVVLAVGILFGICISIFARRNKDRGLILSLVLGIVLYVLYVTKIGGDFMSGRFFTAPVFMTSLILSLWLPDLLKRFSPHFMIVITIMCVAGPVAADIANPDHFEEWRNGVIAHERTFYNKTNLLFEGSAKPRGHTWSIWGGAEKKKTEGKARVIHMDYIGMYGYHSGPNLIIIDAHALSEPFLARLAAQPNQRVGHYARDIPEGYLHARETGDYSLIDPVLQPLAINIKEITQYPIWSTPRWRAIWEYYRD